MYDYIIASDESPGKAEQDSDDEQEQEEEEESTEAADEDECKPLKHPPPTFSQSSFSHGHTT